MEWNRLEEEGSRKPETNMGILCVGLSPRWIYTAQKGTQKAERMAKRVENRDGCRIQQAMAALSLHRVMAAFELRAYD